MNPQQITKLVRIGHMYSFLNSILFEVILFVTSQINMYFFITSTKVIFGLLLPFSVPSTWIN